MTQSEHAKGFSLCVWSSKSAATPVNLLIESLEADSASILAPPSEWPLEPRETFPPSERVLFFGRSDDDSLIIRCPLEKPETPALENDWFEMALQAELPVRPIRSSWGDDDEDVEEEIPDEDAVPADDEDPDPFDDFDEEDFDDDFDDDFEEELDDEYEIEPKDDGFVIGTEDPDLDPDEEEID
jgi:hypothetical protein